MSVRTLQASFRELLTSYNTGQATIAERIRRADANFSNYNFEYQRKQLDDAKARMLAEFKTRAAQLKGKVETERKQITQDIGRVKFPGITSKDPTERAAGEAQANSALTFLSTPHPGELIASTVRSAIDMNRVDFAFTVIDGVLATVEKNIAGQPKPSEAQRVLFGQLSEIQESFPGMAKVRELETERGRFPALETMAVEYERQINAGVPAIVSPELFPALSEAERAKMLQDIGARGNLMEQISFKRRISEAMS